MSDLAVLGLRFETDGAENANRQLDQVADKSAKAERATDALAGSNRRAGSAIAQMVASIERGVRDLVAMAQAQLILASHTQTATAATTAQTSATNTLATATVAASTANVRFSHSFSVVQSSAAAASVQIGQADAHMQAYLTHMSRGSRVIGDADAHMVAYRENLTKVGRSMRLTASEGLNMSRQIADIGVTAAMGMNPLMIALQQGPQLFDIMQTAAVRSGATIRATMAATGAAAWAALAPLLPIIAAIGLALAAIAAPFAIAAQQINAQNKGLIDSLGLTKDQLDNVKNTGVTMGDVLTGVWTATSKALVDAFGPQITAVKNFFGDLYQSAVDGAVAALKGIVGGFTGGFAAIRATWAILPRALGDAAYTAANVVLRAIQAMANGGIGVLNTLIAAANAAANAIPGIDAFIPMLNAIELRALANPFAGAMTQVGEDGGAAFSAGFERGAGRVDGFLESISNEIEAAARRRILREAGDAADSGGSPGTERAARAVQEIQRMLPEVNVQLRETGTRIRDELVDPLELAAREMALVHALAQSAGQGMADSFGRAGDALGGMLTALTGYADQLAAIDLAKKKGYLDDRQAARERTAAEVRSYGDMTDAARGFFDEKSAGYKALTVATQVFRAIEFGLAVKAMVVDNAETIGKIASSAKRAAAYAAEAVANAFKSIPFPFNIAAAAAVAAAMVGLGIKIFGGGGGGAAAPTLPTTSTGTGTVLGDGTAQSQSLGNSLDMAERYYRSDLEFSSKMVSSLRSIQDNIGSVATAIGRQTGVGGGLNASGLNLGTTTSGGFLGIGATTRTSELADQGINLSGGSLAQLIAQGVSGSLYQIVQTTSRNNGFLGIGASTRTSNNETTSGLGSGLSTELTRLLGSLRTGVLTAAAEIGVTGAEAILDAFQVNIGRISFEGLSNSEISETLSAVFSAVGDDMAAAILPGLSAFQRAGEGAMETLSRLAVTFRAVDTTLASIGLTFNGIGLSSLDARNRLVELSGGLDAFIEGADFFAENFLTDAQRIAPVQAAVTAELSRLGVAADISRTGFADLVMGLDVSTSAGAEMFAALMRLAPALDQVITYQDELTGVMQDQSDLLRQRRGLEIELMDAQGNAIGALAARRADELAAMDASLRPLREAIWAQLDLNAAQEAAATAANAAAQAAGEREALLASYRAQAETDALALVEKARDALSAAYEREASALQGTIDKFRGFSDSLRAFNRSLGLQAGSPGSSMASSRAEFERTAALARLGNEEALGRLQGVSEDYLSVSRDYSKTSLDYQRNLANVRTAVEAAAMTSERQASAAEQQLGALNASVAGLMTVNSSVLSVRDAIAQLASAQSVLNAATPMVANPGREWGINPDVNRLLARETGYNGDFGSGGWQAWIEQQDEATKAQGRAILAAQGQAYRIAFADGGVFTNGIVTRPTTFNMGLMGEAGPEAIMPLSMGPDGLGVRMTGGANDNSEMAALRQEVAMLRTAIEQVAMNTRRGAVAGEKHLELADRIVNGRESIVTEAAA